MYATPKKSAQRTTNSSRKSEIKRLKIDLSKKNDKIQRISVDIQKIKQEVKRIPGYSEHHSITYNIKSFRHNLVLMTGRIAQYESEDGQTYKSKYNKLKILLIEQEREYKK